MTQDASGPQLHVGGDFLRAGGKFSMRTASWDGQSWISQPGLGGPVDSLHEFDSGSGPALLVGGRFDMVIGGPRVSSIVRLTQPTWAPLGAGVTGCASPDGCLAFRTVHDMASFDEDGPGPVTSRLIAGGDFQFAGSESTPFVAQWTGQNWLAMGPGLNGPVISLLALDASVLGSPLLVAGGEFTAIAGGPSTLQHAATWNGFIWAPLGAGLPGDVHALAVFDDGSGPALHAAGDFAALGHVARWTGTAWIGLDGGVGEPVHAMRAFDDGSGPALYVGGEFTTADGMPAGRIAKWDGRTWHFVPGLDGPVYAFTEFQGDLIAGGRFHLAEGGLEVHFIAALGCPSLGDFNEDGFVNGVDLGILLAQWDGDGSADLNKDGVVNGIDLGILLAHWTL